MENRWKLYQANSEWIKYSDNKASIILTVYGILITIVYTNANEVYNAFNNSIPILIIGILVIIASLISIYFAFNCINPSLENKNPKSIIYFGHIANKFKTFEEYDTELEANLSNNEKFKKQLSEQIFTNSKIAWTKFKNVTWSIRFFVITLCFLLIQILMYLTSSPNVG